MGEFSTTVRMGFFTDHTLVKKVANKICRNRRKKTEGKNTPPRRSYMGYLDVWIDRWVRVWQCRDMIVSVAIAHDSIRETLGAKKLKRMFQHRMDGIELPEELGVLTFSPLLWKGMQKRIRAVERSLKRQFKSPSPDGNNSNEDEDEDEIDADAAVEVTSEEPLLQSIEEEEKDQNGLSRMTPRVERKQEPQDQSPTTEELIEPEEDALVTESKKAPTGKPPGDGIAIFDLTEELFVSEQQTSSSDQLDSQKKCQEDTKQTRLQRGGLEDPKPGASGPYHNDVDNQGGEDHLTTPVAEETPRNQANVSRSIHTASGRPQRLRAGTFSAGARVAVGWDRLQLKRVGANVTAQRDYRQGVFATISSDGRVNFRLRSQNMLGELVPPEFRLKRISVPHSDIVYYPKFRGISYDEVRLEVARQSHVPISQRTVDSWMPTPLAESNDTELGSSSRKLRDRLLSGTTAVVNATDTGTKFRARTRQEKATALVRQAGTLDAFTGEDAINKKENQTVLHSSTTLDTRRRNPSVQSRTGLSPNTSRKDSNENPVEVPSPDKTGIYDAPRPLEGEAKTQQSPIASLGIPCSGGRPFQKQESNVGRPTIMSRITPPLFYGAKPELSGHGGADHDQSLLRQQDSDPDTQASARLSQEPHSKNGLPLLPSLNTPISYAISVQSDSDNESFPDIEELYRRRWFVEEAEASSNPSVSQQRRVQSPEYTGSKFASAYGKPRASPSSCAQIYDQELSQADVKVPSVESIPNPHLNTNVGGQEGLGKESQAQSDKTSLQMSPQSKKRTRGQSMLKSAGHDLQDNVEMAESPNLLSSTDGNRLTKRWKQLPGSKSVTKSGPSHTWTQSPAQVKPSASLNLPEPSLGSAKAPTSPDKDKQFQHPNDSLMSKGKGKVATRDFTPTSMKTIGEPSSSRWKSKPERKTPSHRFTPYGQPPTSNQPPRGKQGLSDLAQIAEPWASSAKSSGPYTPHASSKERRKGGGNGRRRSRRPRPNSRGKDNRFIREMTTNTIDFRSFSPDRKYEYLHHKVTDMKEELHKTEKQLASFFDMNR